MEKDKGIMDMYIYVNCFRKINAHRIPSGLLTVSFVQNFMNTIFQSFKCVKTTSATIEQVAIDDDKDYEIRIKTYHHCCCFLS